MSEQNDIPRADGFEVGKTTREYVDANENNVPDEFEMDISQTRRKRYENRIIYHGRRKDSALKRIFNAVKNTITAKNNTGRALRGLGIAAVAMITGINIEPLTQPTPEATMQDFFTDVNFWAIISFLFGLAATWLKTKTGAKLDSVIDDAEGGLVLFGKFKQKESDGGTQVTEAEKDLLIDHFAEIFKKQTKKAA